MSSRRVFKSTYNQEALVFKPLDREVSGQPYNQEALIL
jgi:hypothetical protein